MKRVKMSRQVNFVKADDERQIVYGVVYEPEKVDSQGDYATAKEIEKAAHSFMLNQGVIKIEHNAEVEAAPVESFIAPADFVMDGASERVKKGSWVLGVKVFAKDMWEAIKSGEYTGFSMAGEAVKVPE